MLMQWQPTPCYILPVRENEELFSLEEAPWASVIHAGIDEVGIGPLAGPVVAAAVILEQPIPGVTDSKALSHKRRLVLAETIKAEAVSWAIAEASVEEIDQLNILRASHLAMQRAVSGLAETPELAVVDGNKAPELGLPVITVVKGDALVPAIGAASILAKVYRDTWMCQLAERYPDYGFDRHKGYPTRAHKAALKVLGPCAEHRQSYAPVRAALNPPEQIEVSA